MQLINLTSITLLLSTFVSAVPPQAATRVPEVSTTVPDVPAIVSESPTTAVPEVSTTVPEELTTLTKPPTLVPSALSAQLPKTYNAEYNISYPAENGHPWPYHGMDVGIVKRDPTGVWGFYECEDEFWRGKCHWTQIFKGKFECHNQYYGPMGSFGPDPGVTCTCYSLPNCVALSNWKAGFKYPGTKECENNKFMSSGGYLVECPRSYMCTVDD